MQTPETHLLTEIEREKIMNPATSGERFLNRSVDGIGMIMLIFLIISLTTKLSDSGILEEESNFRIVLFFLFALSPIIYYTFLEGITKGRTLGKLVTKTKVVRENGDAIGFKEAAIRSLCRLIPLDGISILFGAPWHDQLSKTKVIKVD
jgi:uncharacterized RDD family membrane protein YckC